MTHQDKDKRNCIRREEKGMFRCLIKVILSHQFLLPSSLQRAVSNRMVKADNGICIQLRQNLWFFFLFFSFCFSSGLLLWHMEVPRLESESELQLPAYAIATAMPDPSCLCDLPHRSWQCWIFNPLSKARDWTHILMDTNQVCNLLGHNRNSWNLHFARGTSWFWTECGKSLGIKWQISE